MKASELRTKSKVELQNELEALFKERFNLRIQKGTGMNPKSHLFKRIKSDIARIHTILNEEGRNND